MDIAVIGFSGRFPGASNSDLYWKNLCKGIDSIKEVAPFRWDPGIYYHPEVPCPGHTYSKWGGFIDDIDQFDASFFNIPPAEAQRLDPQQRLFLELGWETVEHAGYARETLSGSCVGVFVGVCNNSYAHISVDIDAPGINGLSNSRSLVANRFSHFMNFKGPSLAVDSQCTSSLMALHLAYRSLLAGECELALVGGVNLLPEVSHFIKLSQMTVLSRSRETRVFDRSADGFILGECAAALLLKPLPQALEHKDTIHAVIKGTAVYFAGKTPNIMAPEAHMIADSIKNTFQNSGIDPASISYIECGATGTPTGDAAEIKGLKSAFMSYFKIMSPCPLGSVVPNIGNSEAATGIANLVKVILALKHKQLPPTIHFNKPNPLLKLEATPFYINTQRQDWKVAGDQPRRALINSTGIGGTLAQVIVESAPPARTGKTTPVLPYHLLLLSAKTKSALKTKINDFKTFLQSAADNQLADICYTANTGRTHFNHRAACIAGTRAEFVAALEKLAAHGLHTSFIQPLHIYFKPYTPRSSPKGKRLSHMLTAMGIDPPTRTTPKADEPRGNAKANKNPDQLSETLDNICKMYMENKNIMLHPLYDGLDMQKTIIPGYPFEHKRYWLNITGKIHKKNRPGINNRHLTRDYSIPSTTDKEKLVKVLAEIFAKELERQLGFSSKEIDYTRDFSEYGFDSIFVISLVKLYGSLLDMVIPPDLFSSYPTIRDAAVELVERFLNKEQESEARVFDSRPLAAGVEMIPAAGSHFPVVRNWMQDEATARWLDPFFHNRFTVSDFAFFLRKKDKKTFIINEHQQPVGIAGLIDIDPDNACAEAWMAIGDLKSRAKGIALQAGLFLLNYAFDEAKLNTVLLKIREDNQPASIMAEYYGFRKVGLLHESLKYKGQWYNRCIYQMTCNEFNRLIKSFCGGNHDNK
ncbi:MAG: GNAT family N-acetyltransferase [Candidatus Aminicenantes bacterium]|jgi:3-oxoacyl-(acyl-carrier-protein) synthase/RimJ/RimL family protein N-acetyltransferase